MNGETTLARAFRNVYLLNIFIVIVLSVYDIVSRKGISKDFGTVFAVLLGILSAVNFGIGICMLPLLLTEKPIKQYAKAFLLIAGIMFLFSYVILSIYPLARS